MKLVSEKDASVASEIGKGIQIYFMLCNLKILIKQEMKVLSRDRIFHHYYYNFDFQPQPWTYWLCAQGSLLEVLGKLNGVPAI